MKATTRIMVHLGHETRWFDEGDEIPADLAARIGNPAVVDEPLPHLVAEAEAAGLPAPGPDPFVGLRSARTVDDVLAWVHEPDAATDRLARAGHALDVELANRARSTLITTLRGLIDDLTEATTAAPVPAPPADQA